MDIISIYELKTSAIIGVHDYEKEAPQELLLTIHLGVNVHQAIVSDLLVYTVDYDALSKTIIEFVLNSRFELIEALAGEIIKQVFEFSTIIQTVDLTLFKPNAIPLAKSTSFRLFRER